MESRRVAREKLKEEQAGEGVGRENLYPAALPSMPQIRMTRCIDGEESVLPDMVNKNNEHSVGMIADCRKTGAVWEVQITRLIPPAALTGQIGGIAAKLAIQGGTSPNRLDVKDVQKAAESKGIVLHI